MSQISHPGSFIASEITDVIRNNAAEAEKLVRLHDKQLEVIYRENWFNLFVPKFFGGLELSLPEALRVEEALAWADGSMGWTVTLCSGANWFIGFLDSDAAKEIFLNPKVCLAGSGKVSAIAKITGNGYEISGLWKYASGAPHATVFTVNCVIERDGLFLKDDFGNSLVNSFWFWRSEVIIHEDWNCMGMTATASHSFEVKQIQVPKNRAFVIDSATAVLNHPVYKFPFLQFAETTLAVNMSGMATCFLDLAEKLLQEKMQQNDEGIKNIEAINEKIGKAGMRLNAARKLFYTTVEKAWSELLLTDDINEALLNELSKVCHHLAKNAREIVDALYPYCGLIAASHDSEINRVWRNLHTASQHSLLSSFNEE
ncbi:acyl-CoA dehydrogenase [Terrimonas pollutisoli]|uniref:acyl-CoA dehydrogenase n=1 Tax=Terrimonas pollutisoli TaxID=3034147 RepID=UPI0023EAC68A|nr:acyl-CoA dehydrogenase [Terrimonas sp. H1YJ31]